MESRDLRAPIFSATSMNPYFVLLSVLEARLPPGYIDRSEGTYNIVS